MGIYQSIENINCVLSKHRINSIQSHHIYTLINTSAIVHCIRVYSFQMWALFISIISKHWPWRQRVFVSWAQSEYLIEEAHHAHEGGCVSLLPRDALNLRLGPLEEHIQVIQHQSDLQVIYDLTYDTVTLQPHISCFIPKSTHWMPRPCCVCHDL